jgi:hypothetical protein
MSTPHTYVLTIDQTVAYECGASARVEEGIIEELTRVGVTPCTVVVLLSDGSVACTLDIEGGSL